MSFGVLVCVVIMVYTLKYTNHVLRENCNHVMF